MIMGGLFDCFVSVHDTLRVLHVSRGSIPFVFCMVAIGVLFVDLRPTI